MVQVKNSSIPAGRIHIPKADLNAHSWTLVSAFNVLEMSF